MYSTIYKYADLYCNILSLYKVFKNKSFSNLIRQITFHGQSYKLYPPNIVFKWNKYEM
jgi:hypothetical protein